MTALAGFLLASKGDIAFWTLFGTLAGTALVIASGCVFNNYLDRGIDKKMERTKKRALVTGEISVTAAIIYACILGILGFWILAASTNAVTVAIGAVGIIAYVAVYGYFKRASVHGTLIGGISGATSLVAGYCAVTGHLDLLALLLFLVMAAWQMPHFYAVGIYRLEDYKAAGLPIMPAKRGIAATKRHILFYTVLFALAACALPVYGYAGYAYLGVMFITSILWVRLALKGFGAEDDGKWAGKLFGFSLLVLLIFSLMISINHYLP
jgi:protoheme IX farnesyltransferase